MLSCRDIAKKASDHIDKELTLRQSLGYGFHLLLCAYCRKFVGNLRSTVDLSHQLSDQDLLSDEEAACIATKALEQEQPK